MAKVEILQQKGYNFLWIDNCLWMWDIPSEQVYQRELAEKSSGDVLVAGYGLGVVQRYLAKNRNVRSLLTIEKYLEVIDACRRVYGKIYGDIEIGDFYDFNSRRRFDYVIGDIWEDQEEQYLPDYVMFKKKALTLVKTDGKVLAWGENFFEYLLDRQPLKTP